jgi:deoxyribonuclease IV
VRVGAHLRSGLRTAIPLARETAAEVVQLFISNPRAWSGPRLETAKAFGAEWREAAIGPLFVHAPYLVNIASPNPEFLSKSVELCRRSIAACGVLQAGGFVVHSGAGGEAEVADALDRSATVLQATLAETPDETQLLVELMAGTSGAVASTLGEARTLFDAVDDERLGLVLDTCHLFATGYALDEPEGVDACFAELRASGVADRLTLIHANDAKFPRGSRRDRHENIGEGEIGLEGFRAVLRQPEVADISVIVETPHGGELHRRDVNRLRTLAP